MARILGKYLASLDLSDREGVISYTAYVSPEDFWRRVGELLERSRKRRGWKNPIDVEHHGGPSYAIVQNHENGEVKTVDAFQRHAEALGLTVVDLFRSALAETKQSISPEASRVLRVFERTTIEGRAALLGMAQALEAQLPAQEQAPEGTNR